MTKDDYDLDNIIKSSFEETIEYFNENGIKVERLRLKLRIAKSLWSFYDIFICRFIILVFICSILYYVISIPIRNPLIIFIIAFVITAGYLLFLYQRNLWIYFPLDKKIFIIKKQLEKTVNRILDELSNNNIKDYSIIGIKLSKNSIISYPFYVDMKNIKNNIIKTATDSIVTHEIGHHIVGLGEWKASAFEYLVYFYKNELYRYPKVYEIIEENIKRCERFIREKDPNPSTLGACFANDLIYIHENLLNKDKQSPKLNIKDIIEKLKYFSEDEYIDATKMINTLTKILILLY